MPDEEKQKRLARVKFKAWREYETRGRVELAVESSAPLPKGEYLLAVGTRVIVTAMMSFDDPRSWHFEDYEVWETTE